MVSCISLFLISAVVITLPQNGTRVIDWWLISGGGDPAAGGDYSIESAIGEPVVGTSSGGGFTLTSGFTAGTGSSPILDPEMDVQGGGQTIVDGDTSPSPTDDTDFGSIDLDSGTAMHTFTIENTGDLELNLTDSPKVNISGTHAGDFTVTSLPTSPVAASGGTTTFEITFDPGAAGLREAEVSIANDDLDENPYNFAIQGTGTVVTHTLADFDGDGNTDVSVYRPSNGRWYIEGIGNFKWGYAGDLPVPGDYDGDGTTDIAIFRPSNGKWYVMGSAPAS